TIELLKATDKSQVLALHPAVLSPEYQPDGLTSMEKSKEMDGIARARGYHRFEWLHRKLDGEVFPVEVTLNAVQIGGKPELIVVWHDLTEIKRAEAELRRRTEELAAINFLGYADALTDSTSQIGTDHTGVASKSGPEYPTLNSSLDISHYQ